MTGTDRRPLAADARIALALSGGGSRAAAFHLGTLRALRATGLLDRVATISAVSGGSVLAALYCSCPGDFDAFEGKARRALARGFVTPALLKAVTTSEGLEAVANVVPIAADRLAGGIADHPAGEPDDDPAARVQRPPRRRDADRA